MKLIFVLSVLFWALWAAAFAKAAPNLNQVASDVVGRNVSVDCEQDFFAWKQKINTVAPGHEPGLVNAYVIPGYDEVHLSPRVCRALTIPVVDAGYSEFSLALLALLHEAIHLRGIVNEAVTECLAMSFVNPFASKYFGVPKKVVAYRKLPKSKLYKRVLVNNPVFAKIQYWVSYWHRQKPKTYQGGC